MTATPAPADRATHATAFNSALFDERCEALGVTTEIDKAALVEVDTSTLHRFRKGEMGPRLEVARRFARRLEVQIEDLWPDVAR